MRGTFPRRGGIYVEPGMVLLSSRANERSQITPMGERGEGMCLEF